MGVAGAAHQISHWSTRMATTLTLSPVSRTNGGAEYFSRVAILATDYLGNTKGQWYSASMEEAASFARDLIGCVDTKVYLFNTDSDGDAVALPFALISKESGYMSHPSCIVDECNGGSCAGTVAL
jgi:hypothetical protein